MSKILLIDWNAIVKSDKLIRFPVNVSLATELFGDHVGVWRNKEFQEKYEDKLNALFENMRNAGIKFFSPGGSALRRLLTMLWWSYIKKGNLPERNSKYFIESFKEYEDTYNIDPELFEYLYNEYYEHFQDNYVFEVFDDVQRLIDRKPDDWKLGIFSGDRAEDELNIILDKLKSIRDYGDVFKLRFGANGLITAYSEDEDIVFSDDIVAKKINRFKQQSGLDIFLLYRSQVVMYDWAKHFNSKVKLMLLDENDLVDRFDFDNPGTLQDVDDTYQVASNQETSDNPKKIAFLHDIVMDMFPFTKKVVEFIKDRGELIGFMFLTYSLIVALTSPTLEWLGFINSYEDVIFYAVAIPAILFFILWIAFWLLIIITGVPVDTMNRYYKNIDSGLDASTSTWKAIKPVIIWTTILILLYLVSREP